MNEDNRLMTRKPGIPDGHPDEMKSILVQRRLVAKLRS